MPTDKAAELIAELGVELQLINGTGAFYNTIVADGIDYGIETFNPLGDTPTTGYPRVDLIANDINVTDFSTNSCARTEIEITINAYLWKGASLETGLSTYQDSMHFCKDLRTAFRNYLNKQSESDVDADLYTNSITQSIAYVQDFSISSLHATLIFDEKLGD